MDKIFGKFGIYDFMGVWGPGAIFVLHSLFTCLYIFKIDIFSELQKFQCDYSLMLIFIFCLLSYFCGVFFHEIGKGICDMFKPFDMHSIFNLRNRRCFFLKKRLKTFTLNIEKTNYEKINPTVYDAMNYIRNNDIDKMTRIDKSRSIYGFSRGTVVGMIIHILLLIIYVINCKDCARIIILIVFDLIICIVFLLRTFRYRYIWIEKTFIVYDHLMNK